MGYTAQDENLFDKKIKVTLDRYDNLRNDYNEIIKNYNGVNLIVDNPTASAYPYLNEKIGDSSIPKEYRDRKYLSFINESEVDKEFNGGESGSFDITKGFYKIVLIGGGSGGIAYGMIEGHHFTIEDGITNGKLTTTGGSVVGGQIIGGTQIGNAIINAMIIGGTAIGGTTIGGDTSGGQLIPSKNAVSPVQKPHSSVIDCEEQNKKIQEELNSHINNSNTISDTEAIKIQI